MAKKSKDLQLRLGRVDFYRLRGIEFFEALFRCIDRALGEGSARTRNWARLNPHQQGLHAWWGFLGDVQNGGLAQYFYNHTDVFAPALEAILDASENSRMAELLRQATEIHGRHKEEFQVENPFGEDGLFARMTDLAKLDRPVARLFGRSSKALEKWVRANIALIALGDSGEPIDPDFSGEIETHHPNGNVFEQATVRKGTLGGAYRRYLDDGTLEHTCFYKGGEVSADYWPNGNPKHKTIKRGKLKVDEWYYPSGQIQKRHVADKTGFAVEPIHVWHENGQLAEEIHTEEGDRLGPWLKFFEDGSPRLQAEFREDETLVVRNAWDDRRIQIVKDGNGTYFDDGVAFDISYGLKCEHLWTHSRTLKDGIPHETSTTWHQGVLWGTDHYKNGKLDGEQILFYDNGRVRTRTTYRNDEETKSEEFPKFDDPRPAVLISVEANAKLYEAWGHPLLDAYPTPINLEPIQAQLAVPAFLQEVFEKNQSSPIFDGYDNINTFDDTVAYAAIVDERGAVEKVQFTGASPYSAGTVNDYPPILEKLTFEPGRIGSKTMRCRVIVWVHHTFVEGRPRPSPTVLSSGSSHVNFQSRLIGSTSIASSMPFGGGKLGGTARRRSCKGLGDGQRIRRWKR